MSNLDTVHGVYKAFRTGDLPAVIGAMDASMEWSEAEGNPYEPTGIAWHGPDAVQKNLFDKVPVDWARFVVEPQQFHDAGDTVVVEGRYLAKHKVTGGSMDAQFCHVWKLRDEKLVSFQQYVDTAQMRAAMGAE